MTRDLPALLVVAKEAAAKAVARIRLGRAQDVRRKGPVDFVTEVDLAAEAIIRETLQERSPGIAVLAEEGGGAWGQTTRWIVDPLDGTTNFVHGYPAYAVSIGLEIDGRIDVAVVHDAAMDVVYSAMRGGGAWRGTERLHVSGVKTLSDALLCMGFPYDRRARAGEYLRYVEAMLRRCDCVRRGGAASLDFAHLAAGEADGYWEFGLKPWDVAAGCLLVEEAGGRVTDMAGGALELERPRLLCSNGLIHDELLAVLVELLETA